MKKITLTISLLLVFALTASAQGDSPSQPFSQLRKDYNQVGIVAHIKINSIKLAAPDVHPLYVVQSEIIEPFKGRIKRGQQLEFYFHAEEDFDVNELVGDDWVVFLEGKYPIPQGGKGWYELENSKLFPSKMNLAGMRKIKSMRKRVR